MWPWIWARVLRRLFGEGFSADIASRGAFYLVEQVKDSLDHEEERLTSLRLTPGETVTIVARPPADRAERRLAAEQRQLLERDRAQGRPSRAQLRAARRLRRAQRRLERRRPGTRRWERAARQEEARGARFDRAMRPSRRRLATQQRLAVVGAELDASRELRYEAARAARRAAPRRGRGRRPRVTVFD
jgi:hypothetical protein